jgi:redox-sensing transcriptional repressor
MAEIRFIPEATVGRLPIYLRALIAAGKSRTGTVSSDTLAKLSGVNAAKVRKDLSYLGTYGTRGVGYDADHLVFEISRQLGLTKDLPVAIVGFGNLGRALASYRGFGERGFRIAAIFDTDPAKVGARFGNLEVRHPRDMGPISIAERIAIGIIATPAAEAQAVADQLVAAGVSCILNFAPCVIEVPPGVSLRKVDLSIELQILSFYQERKTEDAQMQRPARSG